MIFVLTLILIAIFGTVVWYCSSYAYNKWTAYRDLNWEMRQEQKAKGSA